MFDRMASFALRRRRIILVLAVVTFAVAGAVGGGVANELSSGGFSDPGAESSKAEDALLEEFGAGTPNFILLVTATGGRTVDDPTVAADGAAITAELAAEAGLTNVVSYWSAGNAPPLRNEDASRALVLARIEGSDDEMLDRAETLSPQFRRTTDAVDVRVGGFAEVFREVGDTIEHDLVRAETIAIPITLILLLLVFGSLTAAVLPLFIGALSVVSTFVVLLLLNRVTEVSVFALNLTTAMGLGLAIDYSLFVVTRYREELHAGYEPDEAVRRTVRTAGRTVAFSGLTVAASLFALLVFPLAFLRSFAYAGVAVALLAAFWALVVLPAILGAVGHNIDRFTLWKRSTATSEHGFWHRMAMAVMRRPVPIATAIIIVLLFLGSPVRHLSLGLPDDRVLPPSKSSREVSDVIRHEFTSEEAGALALVAIDAGEIAGPTATADIDAFAAQLSTLPDTARVDAITGSYIAGQRVVGAEANPSFYAQFSAETSTWLRVVPSVEPLSAEGEGLVKAIRATEAPFPLLVGGQSAQLVDSKESLIGLLPLAIAIIAVITFVLLFLMFGSVVVPLKALVLNVLSLSATFGAMVWVFQDGHLSSVIDVTTTGSIAATTPILMFCVAFGLSMDYEVFLLSRIKEEHDRSGDNVASVALGLERTGRIVTAAALLISVVFIAFATSQVSFIKLFGVGLTLAVLLDAFLIRGTLVPAFMRLAGEANWWAPPFLRRVHDRFGISEHVADDADAADPLDEADGQDGPDERTGELVGS